MLGTHDRSAGHLGDARQLSFAVRGELGRQRFAVVAAANAADLTVRPRRRELPPGCGRRSERHRSGSLPLRSSRQPPPDRPRDPRRRCTRTITRTWSRDFGSRAKTFMRRFERAGGRGSSDRHVVRFELPKELSDGRAVARQRETHRFTGERHRPETRPRQVADQPGHLGLRARNPTRHDVARIHALRVVQHHDDIEVRGRNDLVPLPNLGRDSATNAHSIASTRSTPLTARRPVASYVISGATTLGSPNARTARPCCRLAHPTAPRRRRTRARKRRPRQCPPRIRKS